MSHQHTGFSAGTTFRLQGSHLDSLPPGIVDALQQLLAGLPACPPALRTAIHRLAALIMQASAPADEPPAAAGGEASPSADTGNHESESSPIVAFRIEPAAAPRNTAQAAGHDSEDPAVDPPAGDALLFPRPDKPRYSDVTDQDLGLIIDRCRLKATGARWAVERDERLEDGADFHTDIRPVDQKIIARARRLPNCFLWMNQPREDIQTRADDYLLVGDCFETLSEAVRALQMALAVPDSNEFKAAVDLVAEAQSAVRVAVARVEPHPDSDQQLIYHWLRNRAGSQRFYISRYMKISDPADPERCDDVLDEALALQDTLRQKPVRSATDPERERRSA